MARRARDATHVPLVALLLLAWPQCFGGALPSSAAPPPPPPFGGVRLAFGSCSGQDEAQPLWAAIVAREPDAFAWLGDIVYADHPRVANSYEPATLAEVAAAYAMQRVHPEYAALLRSGIPIVGTFDDHDLGVNDADRTVPRGYRLASQQLLLDFLGTPPHSVLRHRDGAYSAHVLDGSRGGGRATLRSADASGALPRRADGGARVRLILLDVRSHKDPFPSQPRAGPGDAGAAPQDMLGATQWAFLEAQLQASGGDDVTLVASGIQVLGTADPLVAESWSRLPQSQARLLALLRRYPRAVLLSGDVHFGEANALELRGRAPLVELTSSGMSHSWGGWLRGTLVHSLLLASTRTRPPAGAAAPAGAVRCASDLPAAVLGAALARAARAVGLERVAAAVDTAECYVSGLNSGEVDVHVDASGAAAGVTLRVWGADGVAHIEQRLALPPAGPPPPDAPLDAAAAACLREPLAHGLTPACRAVLDAMIPRVTARELVAWYAAHVIVALLLGVVLTFALALPFLAARGAREHWQRAATDKMAPEPAPAAAAVAVAGDKATEAAALAAAAAAVAGGVPLWRLAAASAVGFVGTCRVAQWLVAIAT